MEKTCVNAYVTFKNKDALDQKLVSCILTKEPCVAQRYCSDLRRYIVSERAKSQCNKFVEVKQ